MRLARSIVMGLSVVGAVDLGLGACLPQATDPYTPPVPTLQPVYVAQNLSQTGRLIEDANRNPIRVYADTLYFTLSDSTFIQATRYGAYSTGSEVLTNRRSAPQKYTLTSGQLNNLTLPGLIGGAGAATLFDDTYLNVTTTPSGSTTASYYWSYRKP